MAQVRLDGDVEDWVRGQANPGASLAQTANRLLRQLAAADLQAEGDEPEEEPAPERRASVSTMRRRIDMGAARGARRLG